jgi:thioredoxin 1
VRLSAPFLHQTAGAKITGWPPGKGKHSYKIVGARNAKLEGASAVSATLQRGEKNMAGNGIVEVTDANFDQDVLKSDKPVLVDFWATWCGPCRAIAPIVAELAEQYKDKIKVGKMDVDSNSATPMRYKVTGIPTLLVFKGGQVVEQLVGYRPKDAIAQALDKHIG